MQSRCRAKASFACTWLRAWFFLSFQVLCYFVSFIKGTVRHKRLWTVFMVVGVSFTEYTNSRDKRKTIPLYGECPSRFKCSRIDEVCKWNLWNFYVCNSVPGSAEALQYYFSFQTLIERLMSFSSNISLAWQINRNYLYLTLNNLSATVSKIV